MGFWDTALKVVSPIYGAQSYMSDKANKNIQSAANAYQTGLNEAGNIFNRGQQEAKFQNDQRVQHMFPAVQGGYNTARQDIQGGLNTAHIALNNAGTNARNDITGGANAGAGALSDAMTRIRGYYDPHIQTGTRANALLGTFLGFDGADAAKTAAANFAGNSPEMDFTLDQLRRSAERRNNAVGDSYGSRGEMMTQRALREATDQYYRDYLTRLEGAATRGGQFAGQLSGFENTNAGAIADLRAREAAALSANEQRHGETLARMYAGSPIGSGQLAIGEGNAIGGLWDKYYGTGIDLANLNANQQAQLQTLAGQNLANMYGARNASDQAAVNNMLKVAGLALSPVTGGLSNTAAGALASGIGSAANNVSSYFNPFTPNPYASLGGAYGGGF